MSHAPYFNNKEAKNKETTKNPVATATATVAGHGLGKPKVGFYYYYQVQYYQLQYMHIGAYTGASQFVAFWENIGSYTSLQ